MYEYIPKNNRSNQHEIFAGYVLVVASLLILFSFSFI